MKKSILAHEAEIEKREKAIERIRAKCKHENVTVKYGSNTGNWCPYDDCYWVDVECLDCGWRERFDSKKQKEEYYHYSNL